MRRWSSPAPGLALAMLALGPTLLAAQGRVVAAGRVMRVAGNDTVPVAGAEVVLHRVGRDRQGPVDSLRSGPAGAFRFRYTADTGAVFLLSSGFAGIEYFSTPLNLDPAAPDTGLVLLVSDTATNAPLEVVSRHVVISRPVDDGTRPVLEIAVLGNPGAVTRVAGDSAHPSWRTALPKGALGAQVGQGDVSPEAVVIRNDSLLLFAPIAPGRKQVVFGYTLPAAPGRVRYDLADSTLTYTLLLEERGPRVSGGGLVAADSQVIEGRVFQSWSGAPGAGSTVTIGFGGAGLTRYLLPVLVSLLAGALLLVMVRVLRRPAGAGRPAGSALLDQLARLDAQYAGRESDTPGPEWARYQDERARLKAQLAAELAGKAERP